MIVIEVVDTAQYYNLYVRARTQYQVRIVRAPRAAQFDLKYELQITLQESMFSEWG